MATAVVVYHHEDGSWWAESSDLPGYTAVADSFGDLRDLVIEGVPFFADDEDIEIVERLASGAALH